MAPSRRIDNRVQEVSEISRELKVLAKELNVPVLALSQLSRAIEGRNNHVPQLSDLRESGSIEQDADMVIFIYPGDTPEPNSATGTKLIIAKQRNGPLGEVSVRFDREYVRFQPLATAHQQQMYDRGLA